MAKNFGYTFPQRQHIPHPLPPPPKEVMQDITIDPTDVEYHSWKQYFDSYIDVRAREIYDRLKKLIGIGKTKVEVNSELTSGTKIGTISVDGTDTDIYIPTCVSQVVETGRFCSKTGDISEKDEENDSWFKVYSDGWCEQGGSISDSFKGTITLYRSYSDTTYNVNGMAQDTDDNNIVQVALKPSATNAIDYIHGWSDADKPKEDQQTTLFTWEAKGFVASEIHWFKSSELGDIGQTVENNVISNMSESRINITDFAINFGDKFEIVVAATIGEITATEQDVVGSHDSNYNTEFGIIGSEFWWEAGKWHSSSDKCTYDPVNEAYPGDAGFDETTAVTMRYGLSGMTPESGVKYWFKYMSDGANTISGWVSKTGEDGSWVKDMEVESTVEHTAKLVFGTEYDEPSQYWRGSIDLGNSYVKINGQKYLFKYIDTKSVIVTFNGNGGTPDRDSIEIEVNTGLKEIPSAGAANDYDFLGWFSTQGVSGKEITTDDVFAEDTTVFAHWKAEDGETDPIQELTPKEWLEYDNNRYIKKHTNEVADLEDSYALGVLSGVFQGEEVWETISLKYAKEIYKEAFKNCNSITTVSLPNATIIGQEAFECCVTEEINGKTVVVDRPSSLTSVYIPKVQTIGNAAFRYCTKLEHIEVPSATTIGDKAFVECFALVSFDIPEGTTSIGNNVFQSCQSLESITIPDGVTSVGEYAFRGCKKLTTLEFPESLVTIGKEAFSLCTSLETVKLPGITETEVMEAVKDTKNGNWFNGCSETLTVICKNGVTIKPCAA